VKGRFNAYSTVFYNHFRAVKAVKKNKKPSEKPSLSNVRYQRQIWIPALEKAEHEYRPLSEQYKIDKFQLFPKYQLKDRKPSHLLDRINIE